MAVGEQSINSSAVSETGDSIMGKSGGRGFAICRIDMTRGRGGVAVYATGRSSESNGF